MTINPDNKYAHLFDTSRINKEVKQKSVKAGIANLISQVLIKSMSLMATFSIMGTFINVLAIFLAFKVYQNANNYMLNENQTSEIEVLKMNDKNERST